MRKPLIFPILGIVALSACQEQNTLSLISEVQYGNDIENNHTIPVDTALCHLNEFLKSDKTGTRNGSIKEIRNVITVTNPKAITRANEKVSNNLIYIANFENNEGYAVLAADYRIPEKVIAITECGNIEQYSINAANSIVNNERPIYVDYPTTGPGLFTLKEYGEEIFMNPNTIDLTINDEDGTLVGNFDAEWALPNLELNGNDNEPMSLEASQSNSMAIALCLSYSLNSTDNGSDDRGTELIHPVVPDPEPGGSGSSITTKVSYSPWNILENPTSILKKYVSWNQRSPFNDFCPERRKWIFFGKKRTAPAGCFPLSIAKILTNFCKPDLVTYNGYPVNWSGLKDKICYEVQATSAAALLRSIGLGCDSWYFYEGTFTFPKSAKGYMKDIGFKNVKEKDYSFTDVKNMIDSQKPLIIYSVPGINLSKSHCWNIDGYKIKERIVTKEKYKNGILIDKITTNERYEMVHCDFGHGGESNGYYVSGIFKLNDPNSEKDPEDSSQEDDTYYNNYLHILTYDLP